MKLTSRQHNELEVIYHFIPTIKRLNQKFYEISDFWKRWEDAKITDNDIKSFFDYSECGLPYPQPISIGLEKLLSGKSWREIFTNEILKKEYKTFNNDIDSWMGWYIHLGGYTNDEILPRHVVNYYKKNFKGSEDLIEKTYQEILRMKVK